VRPATIRGWRRRLKSEPVERVSPGLASRVDTVPESGAGDGVAQMRATAAHARRLAAEAAEQSGPLMRAGQAVKVRELSAAGKMWAQTAHALEQAIAVAEAAETRLSEAQTRRMADVVKGFLAAVGVPVTPAGRGVLRSLLVEREPGPDAERAAADVLEHFRGVLRADFAEREVPSEERGEPDPAADDGGDGDLVGGHEEEPVRSDGYRTPDGREQPQRTMPEEPRLVGSTSTWAPLRDAPRGGPHAG